MTDVDANATSPDDSAFDRLERLGSPDVFAPKGFEPPTSSAVPPTTARRTRTSKWDHNDDRGDWRWWVGNVGKTLIATGLLLFGFVAYQLWGTGIETARAQNALENEFEQLLAAPVSPIDSTTAGSAPAGTGTDTFTETSPGTSSPDVSVPIVPGAATNGADSGAAPIEQQVLPDLEDGDALARIEIPSIGVSDIVVAGVAPRDLKRGPGHYPDTPMPGQLGNAAIAGHRTTYGQPFHDVDRLGVGDEIVVTTLNGTFTYRVTGQQIVSPDEYQVVATTDPTIASLTLTSCHPKWSARLRIVISAELVADVSAQVGEPVLNYGRPEMTDATADDTADTEVADAAADEPADGAPTLAGTDRGDDASGVLVTGVASDAIADAFANGWFSDPGANLQVGLWGSLLALIGLGAFLLSRRLRRDWVGAAVGLLPFAVTLYFFFQNVNRLLPPNL